MACPVRVAEHSRRDGRRGFQKGIFHRVLRSKTELLPDAFRTHPVVSQIGRSFRDLQRGCGIVFPNQLDKPALLVIFTDYIEYATAQALTRRRKTMRNCSGGIANVQEGTPRVRSKNA